MLIRHRVSQCLFIGASFTLLSACGQAPNAAQSQPKIVGGESVPNDQADARRWSTVALTTDVVSPNHPDKPAALDRGGSFCSGTIISDRVIVTAAHCIQAFDATTRQKKDEFILPAEHDFIAYFDTKVSRDGQWVRAAHVIPHPDWDPSQTLSPQPSAKPNDIGLVILEDAIPASSKPIAIAATSVSLTKGMPIALAGFGVTESRDKDDTGTMRQVTTSVSSADGNIARVGVGELFKGACAGDSGGPAYIKVDGAYQLVGATSTGAELMGKCLGLMNNYTDVRYYTNWIEETIAAYGLSL